MKAPWRLLACAAAILLLAAIGIAEAQTVIVIKAPPKSPVELALNGAVIASGTADDAGQATLAVNLATTGGKQQTDVHLFVDFCPAVRRVVLVEPGMAPIAGDACVRREIPGLYLMTGPATFVVNVTDPSPSVRLRQGPTPAAWLTDEPERADEENKPERIPAPKGVMVFAGGGVSSFGNFDFMVCGSLGACEGGGMKAAYRFGVEAWLFRFLGAEIAYMDQLTPEWTGSGGGHRFESSLAAHVFSASVKAGVPIGPGRIYVMGGGNYHRARFYTKQTIDDLVVTIDGVDQTIKGGDQESGFETTGWSWQAAGGAEFWFKGRWAIYAEGGRVHLKGDDGGGGEASLDHGMNYGVAGVRVRIGR